MGTKLLLFREKEAQSRRPPPYIMLKKTMICVQKFTRRLEISTCTAEISKRLADFRAMRVGKCAMFCQPSVGPSEVAARHGFHLPFEFEFEEQGREFSH